MSHVDPELLALLALGEDAGADVDRDHLAECPACRRELENLGRTVAIGRSTLGTADLLEPSPRVWAGIQRELGRDGASPRSPAPVVPLRRRWLAPIAAAAAAVLLVSGGAIWWALQPSPAEVLASATLDPFPDWPGAAGEAVVAVREDGARVIDVSVTAPAVDEGYWEVWLIDGETLQLVSLGVLRGSEGSFTVPDGLDLSRFDLVDVSAEAFDGDPSHSGDSIVRGELRNV